MESDDPSSLNLRPLGCKTERATVASQGANSCV